MVCSCFRETFSGETLQGRRVYMARGRAYTFSERGGGGLRFGGCDSSGQWLYIPKTRVYIFCVSLFSASFVASSSSTSQDFTISVSRRLLLKITTCNCEASKICVVCNKSVGDGLDEWGDPSLLCMRDSNAGHQRQRYFHFQAQLR